MASIGTESEDDDMIYINGKGEMIEPPYETPDDFSGAYSNSKKSIYQLSTGDYIDLSLIASIGDPHIFHDIEIKPGTETYQIPVILLHSYEPLYITGQKEVFQELVDAWKKFKGEQI